MADYFCTHCGCRHEPLAHVRHVTAREKLETLAAWLATNEDEDGLDPIEALVADAAAAEPARRVHEGGEYYAERIIRQAIAQGTLILASAIEALGSTEAETPNPNPETPHVR